MAKTITVSVHGLSEAIASLKVMGDRMQDGVETLLSEFAHERVVLPAKEEYVPVVTGNLQGSITAQPPVREGDRITVAVTAGNAAVKYALKVHENPRAGRTGGVSPSGKKYYPRPGLPVPYSTVGQWKFLEQPALIAAKTSKAWLAERAKRILTEAASGTR